MPHRAVRRIFGEPERGRLVPHHLLTGWTGRLEIAWTFERERLVVIGAGWFRVEEQQEAAPRRAVAAVHRRRPGPAQAGQARPPLLAAEIVRRGAGRLPVLPGSSLKGAVRQAYELLSPSCVPGNRDACRVRPKDDRSPQLCPACSLFGAPGVGGRLAFGEATPVGPDAAQRVGLVAVPTAWAPRRPAPGAVRVYGQGKAVGQDGSSAPAPEQTWAAWGEFRSRLRVVNASDKELGLLFAALGLGAEGPSVRVGRKKFHGFGAARVAVVGAERHYSELERIHLDKDEAAAWASDLAGRALADPQRREAWEALHEALRAGG